MGGCIRLSLFLVLLFTPAPEPRLVIPHDCITKIDTEHAYLVGPDLQHMVVYGLKVHYKDGCEYWEVVK